MTEKIITPISFIAGRVAVHKLSSDSKDHAVIAIERGDGVPTSLQLTITPGQSSQFCMAVAPGQWTIQATFGRAESERKNLYVKPGETVDVIFEFGQDSEG